MRNVWQSKRAFSSAVRGQRLRTARLLQYATTGTFSGY
jgi:hypothetical protein